MSLTDPCTASAVTTPALTQPDPATHPDIPVIGPMAGTWTWNVLEDRWWWSDEIYAIHGFEPGEVVPTTALMLAHKVLDDLEKCRSTLAGAKVRPGPFSNYHRIIDTRMRTRHILTVGSGHADGIGRVFEVTGYLVDLTDARQNDVQPAVEEALDRALEHRGVIDLAKGAIMLAHGVDADTAFGILRSTSNVTQLKLRDVALRLVDALAQEPHDPRTETHLDALLQRIT